MSGWSTRSSIGPAFDRLSPIGAREVNAPLPEFGPGFPVPGADRFESTTTRQRRDPGRFEVCLGVHLIWRDADHLPQFVTLALLGLKPIAAHQLQTPEGRSVGADIARSRQF